MAGSTDAGSIRSGSHAKQTPVAKVKVLGPRMGEKKLPWLQGKTSRNPSTLPSRGQHIDARPTSLTTNVSIPKSSTPTVSERATTCSSSTPRRPLIAPKERFVHPIAGDRLSPAKIHRLSQDRQTPSASDGSSPATVATSYRPPVVCALPNRASITRFRQKRQRPGGDSGHVRSRADSHASMTDRHQQSSTSETCNSIVEKDLVLDTLQAKAPRAGRLPLWLASASTDPVQMGHPSILNATGCFEDMVAETAEMADRTSDDHEDGDFASLAFQDGSEDPTSPLMATSIPPAGSGPLENERLDSSHAKASDNQHSRFSSRSSSENIIRDRSGHSAKRDLLLHPQPVQGSSRDHVEFVLRPSAHDHSRSRSERQPAGDSPVSHGKHRSRRRHSSRSESSSYDENVPAKGYGTTLSVREQLHDHTDSLRRHHRKHPIARNWPTGKKRLTATIACINTALLGIIVGVYAGQVPRIQYVLGDEHHYIIIGNAVLYFGLAISTLVAWPLPLLHGRKPYLLTALALTLPLQFPQAIVVSEARSPRNARYRTVLLCARAATGLVLGFANVNYITVLLDLFGASLQSKNPHQETVLPNDLRRHGGGMGMWLGLWSWCWIGSLAVGFQVGALIIQYLSPDWGFYFVVIILAAALVLNIITPETRRAPYRKAVTEIYDRDELYITRRVSRGECKLHISTEGPMYWFEEVWAGMKLMVMMMSQPGFFILSFYLAWIYAQMVLVIVLLGALLSRNYRWQPRYVGAGVMSVAIGAFLAIPLTKAGIFSRERKNAFRTDSTTFQKQVTWSSHLVRRVVFTLALPLMGIAYTVSSAGVPKPHMVPIVFSGALGYFSNLAIAECHGLVMETFDTSDLQAGVNTRHRLESLAVQDRRRRTNYTSFPRISAGIFASQTIAFVLAGVATLVGGSMTRQLGAQASTGVTAGILLGFTILLTVVLWRFKRVQVIPNYTLGTRRDTAAWKEFKDLEKIGRGEEWKAVVIGNPTGKMRRMSVLELGGLSRWTEIRKLNFLLKGPRLGEDVEKRNGFGDQW